MGIHFVVHEDGDSVGVVVVEGVRAGDALTGLHSKTHYGRPNWNNFFEELKVLLSLLASVSGF